MCYVAKLNEAMYTETTWKDGEITGTETPFDFNETRKGETLMQAIENVLNYCGYDFVPENLYNMGQGDIRYSLMQGISDSGRFYDMDAQDYEDWKNGKIRAADVDISIRVEKIVEISDEEFETAGMELY